MKTLQIRKVVRDDIPNLKAVIDSAELFPSELLDEMVEAYLNGEEDSIWLTAEQDTPSFVAYCAPEKMTDGTWNLYLIAVHSNLQGQGAGKQVLAYIESELRARKVRVLIVETSGLPEFSRTREFYRQSDYTEEARIRDFYEAGDDKVVFWKSLTQQPTWPQ